MPWSTKKIEATPPSQLRGLTAAATTIELAKPDVARREAAKQKRRPLPWQRDAWRFFDEVPEVHSGARWHADCQSRMRWFPALLPDDPDQAPIPATEADDVDAREVEIAVEALDRLQSDEGDRAEIQRILDINLFIAGEGWLVGTEDIEFSTPLNPLGERWRAFSVSELVPRDDGRWAIRPDESGYRQEELEVLEPAQTTLIRIYRRHGHWRQRPDSGMRAANLLCEELLLATQAIMGSLRSRLSAGILPVPEELEVAGGSDDEEAEEEEDALSPVLRMLTKHLITPIEDPRSAASQVPFLLQMPSTLIEKMQLIAVAKEIDPQLIVRNDAIVKRLAIGLDMMPERLTGMGDMTHWNLWGATKDEVRGSIEPYTALAVGGVTQKMWRPRLELAGVRNPERWLLWWDPEEVVSEPDEGENAKWAHEAIIISDHRARRSLGFSDEDQPDDEEIERRLERTRKAAAQPPAPPGAEVQPPEPGPAERQEAQERQGAEPVQASASPRQLQRIGALGARWARIESQLARDLLVAADAALRRVLEKAQARIRSAATRAPLGPEEATRWAGQATRALARSLSPDRLPAALGAEQVRALGLSDEELFDGLGDIAGQFILWNSLARARALRELERAGIEPDPDLVRDWMSQGDQRAEEGGALLASGLAAAAAVMLFAPPSPETEATALGEFDATLSAQPGLIRDALSQAGGGAADDAERGGLLSGSDFAQLLDEVDGVRRVGWVWEVGAPARPFEPHQELGGQEFEGFFDPAIEAPPDEFPFVSHYAPGDHDGCQCVAAPVVEGVLIEVPEAIAESV